MNRFLALAAAIGFALPAAAQDSGAPNRVVVATIEAEAIQPSLTPSEFADLVAPLFDSVERREDRRPQFEQSWIERGLTFQLMVDAQFADGNDFVAALPLEEVEEGGRRLLVLTRPRS